MLLEYGSQSHACLYILINKNYNILCTYHMEIVMFVTNKLLWVSSSESGKKGNCSLIFVHIWQLNSLLIWLVTYMQQNDKRYLCQVCKRSMQHLWRWHFENVKWACLFEKGSWSLSGIYVLCVSYWHRCMM